MFYDNNNSWRPVSFLPTITILLIVVIAPCLRQIQLKTAQCAVEALLKRPRIGKAEATGLFISNVMLIGIEKRSRK